MRAYKPPDFGDRKRAAAEAKQAALEKFLGRAAAGRKESGGAAAPERESEEGGKAPLAPKKSRKG